MPPPATTQPRRSRLRNHRLNRTSRTPAVVLGGLTLLDLHTNRILHEIPFPSFSPTTNHSATRNPVALETTSTKLRLYTAPDDGEDPQGTELQVYEAALS